MTAHGDLQRLSAKAFGAVCEAMRRHVQEDRSISMLCTESGTVHWVPGDVWAAVADGQPTDDLPDWEREYIGAAQQIAADSSGRFVEIPRPGVEWRYSVIKRFVEAVAEPGLAEHVRAMAEDGSVVYRIERLLCRVDPEEAARYTAARDEAVAHEAAGWLRSLGFAPPEE